MARTKRVGKYDTLFADSRYYIQEVPIAMSGRLVLANALEDGVDNGWHLFDVVVTKPGKWMLVIWDRG